MSDSDRDEDTPSGQRGNTTKANLHQTPKNNKKTKTKTNPDYEPSLSSKNTKQEEPTDFVSSSAILIPALLVIGFALVVGYYFYSSESTMVLGNIAIFQPTEERSKLPNLHSEQIAGLVQQLYRNEIDDQLQSHIAQQLHEALERHYCDKPLTVLIVGPTNVHSNLGRELGKMYFQWLDESDADKWVSVLNGNDDHQHFTTTIQAKLEHQRESGLCPSHIFVINVDSAHALSEENRDYLGGAFDDSVPLLPDTKISTTNAIFVLLSEVPRDFNTSTMGTMDAYAFIRKKMSKAWTGRFYQRIRNVVGI